MSVTWYGSAMASTHMTLCLLNPAFTEEEGVTVKDGTTIAFRRSDGTPRMLHVNACELLPDHAGLHSVNEVRCNSACKACLAAWELFQDDNEAFNEQVAKTQV